MSETKSILHSILCDYVTFYEYRGEFCFIKILEKNKGIKIILVISIHGTSIGGSWSKNIY